MRGRVEERAKERQRERKSVCGRNSCSANKAQLAKAATEADDGRGRQRERDCQCCSWTNDDDDDDDVGEVQNSEPAGTRPVAVAAAAAGPFLARVLHLCSDSFDGRACHAPVCAPVFMCVCVCVQDERLRVACHMSSRKCAKINPKTTKGAQASTVEIPSLSLALSLSCSPPLLFYCNFAVITSAQRTQAGLA